MSDKIREKVESLGVLWEEAEVCILDFLDNRYKTPTDGIIIGDGENPATSRKMKHYVNEDGTAFIRIRMNKYNRLADSDKVKFAIIVADEKPDLIKISMAYKDKPLKPVKICKVSTTHIAADFLQK